MSRFVKLGGVSFSDTTLPVIKDYSAAIQALPGLLGWFSATEPYVEKDSSGRVNRLIDRSPNGQHFVQVLGGSQPLWVPDYINGEPALQLDSARPDYMGWQGTFPTGTTASHTKLIVARPNPQGSPGQLLSEGGAAGRHLFQYTVAGAVEAALDAGDASVSIALSSVDWYLMMTQHDGAGDQLSIAVDGGAPVTAATTSTITEDALFLGASNALGVSPAEMHVAEIIITSGLLLNDATNLAMIRDYISAKYAIDMS